WLSSWCCSPFGLDTPSLRLSESNATSHPTKFNIGRDIPAQHPTWHIAMPEAGAIHAINGSHALTL
ncbi:hypothetical protein KY389_05355, partial [Paracoccus bogoriensis]|uniref:hypothetical protein n=1 Tax=Paracoccus bogoriensis TaxID=242065 RepID=UPI001CA50799